MGKFTNMWKLNIIFLNNEWVKKGIIGKIENTLRQVNDNIFYQSLLDAAKALIRKL